MGQSILGAVRIKVVSSDVMKSAVDFLRRREMIKYAVYPGYVLSRDGNRHYITASQLANLYRVNSRECIVIDPIRPETSFGLNTNNLINLYPRDDGNYKKGGA